MSLKNKIRLFTDKTFMKFVVIGIVNTIVGTAIMFIGSICSYILNKHFTFKNKERGWKPLLRFTLNIITCYLLAYGIAKPVIQWILSGYSITIQENISLALGMCLFVIFNYLGQRFYTFK